MKIQNLRILIATTTAGGGHLQAAAALEETWQIRRPRDLVQRVDVLDYTPRLFKKIYAEGYVKLIAHAPELYGLAFKRMDNPAMLRKLMRLRRKLASFPTARFGRHLKRFQPDVVLCPHFLPLEIIGNLKGKSISFQPLSVCIITDFEAHALWMEPSVDLYCVAAEETKARLVARGIPPGRVVVTGIPISTRFRTNPETEAVRKQYDLREDLPTLLVLSGGFGMGPVAEILAELDKVTREIQVIVVCGRNEKMRSKLAMQRRHHATRILGFVTNMHQLMNLSDLILTKPGGLTSSEAMALGKPLAIIDPIPGQETANADFLLERGAAIKLNRVDDLPFRVQRLLGSNKIQSMRQAARDVGRPEAAERVCDEVLTRLTEAHCGRER